MGRDHIERPGRFVIHGPAFLTPPVQITRATEQFADRGTRSELEVLQRDGHNVRLMRETKLG